MFRLFASLVVAAVLSVPVIHAQSAPASKPAARGGNAGNPGKAANNDTKPAVVVNLNTATTADLERLPGIGAKVAARIVEYRQKNGQFKKIEELMNVEGIGEKSFLKLRSQLTVGTPARAESPAARRQ